jgi:hypothetical protein
MPSPDPKHLREELESLLDEQERILKKKTFGVATESELREYDSRRDRIHELYVQLVRTQTDTAA